MPKRDTITTPVESVPIGANFEIKDDDSDRVYVKIPEMILRNDDSGFVVNCLWTETSYDTYVAPTHIADFLYPDTLVNWWFPAMERGK